MEERRGGKQAFRSIDLLKRQLEDTIATTASQMESGAADGEAADGDAPSTLVVRLRAQLAEQQRRIAFLEPKAEAALEVEMLKEQVAMLKEQLTSLVQSKVEQMPLSLQADEPKYVRGSIFKSVLAGDFMAMNERRLEVARAMNSMFSWSKSFE